jgi:hypothetical protein
MGAQAWLAGRQKNPATPLYRPPGVVKYLHSKRDGATAKRSSRPTSNLETEENAEHGVTYQVAQGLAGKNGEGPSVTDRQGRRTPPGVYGPSSTTENRRLR